MLLKKFLITTLIAALIWGIIYVVIDQNWISFRANVDPFVTPGSCPFARAPPLSSYCEPPPGTPTHSPYLHRGYDFPVTAESVLLERLDLKPNHTRLCGGLQQRERVE